VTQTKKREWCGWLKTKETPNSHGSRGIKVQSEWFRTKTSGACKRSQEPERGIKNIKKREPGVKVGHESPG
jgi:hypothetical protein